MIAIARRLISGEQQALESSIVDIRAAQKAGSELFADTTRDRLAAAFAAAPRFILLDFRSDSKRCPCPLMSIACQLVLHLWSDMAQAAQACCVHCQTCGLAGAQLDCHCQPSVPPMHWSKTVKCCLQVKHGSSSCKRAA